MARKNPTIAPYKRTKHEEMVDDMTSALYSLSSKTRKPYTPSGDKLLPSHLQEKESAESAGAKKHIERLHKAFKSER